jgi:hypothetical protein
VKHTKEFVESVFPTAEAEEMLSRPAILNVDYSPSNTHNAVINLIITYNTAKSMDYEYWSLDLHLTVNKQAKFPLESWEALLWSIRSELNDFRAALSHKPILESFRRWKLELTPKEKSVTRDISEENFGAGFDLKECINQYYARQTDNLSTSSSSITSTDSAKSSKRGTKPATPKHLASKPQNLFELLDSDI